MLVDKSMALAMQEGDQEFLNELWEVFIQDAGVKISEFERSMAASEYLTVSHLAHSIKSSAQVVGSKSLGSLAANLEQVALKENTLDILSAYALFKDCLDTVLEELREELRQANAAKRIQSV